jgi:hypothetical protein
MDPAAYETSLNPSYRPKTVDVEILAKNTEDSQEPRDVDLAAL